MGEISFHEKENVSLHLSDLSLVEKRSSNLQDISVCFHPDLGKVLIINDEIQHVENWMPYYHESIVHIPMMFISTPKNVLILGGGDLFAAYEVLKYTSIENVVVCDYDKNVVELTKKHYQHANKVFDDERFQLIIKDARLYINESHRKFDLIIDDCFDLVNAYSTSDIFDKLRAMLTDDGVCSSLVYRHIFHKQTMKKTISRLITNHKTVLSLVTVPEYPGILHLLTMWGKSRNLTQNLKTSANLTHNSPIFLESCNLFNSKFCNFYLYLPPYVRDILERTGNS